MNFSDIDIEKQIVIEELYEQLEKLKPEKGLKNVENFKEKVKWAIDNLTPQMHLNVGNRKLPKTILIVNESSWFNCEGRKAGFCELCEKCYDKSPEVRFKERIKDRTEQEIIWRSLSANDIANGIISFIKEWNKHHKIKIKSIRFNEVGEIKNQEDLMKMIQISNKVYEELKIKSYVYTHNKNLNFNIERPYLTINGSNFMVDNEYRVIEKELLENEFNDLYDLSNKRECICDCNNCNYCQIKSHLILIEEVR